MTKSRNNSILVTALLFTACGCTPAPSAYRGSALSASTRVAVIPLANYSGELEAVQRITPMIFTELARREGLVVVDQGVVEEALAKEPWLLTDRLPGDIVQRMGRELDARALLVGSVLAFGLRRGDEEASPQVSVALRLVDAESAEVLWSAVHSRDGADGEWFFGMGRVHGLEQLATEVVREMFETFPRVERSVATAIDTRLGGKEQP